MQPFVPSSLVSSPDGKWIAALRPNETVWIYAVETGEFVCSQVSREAKAIAFNDKSELFIGDRWLRIIQVSLVDNSIKKNYRGNLTSFQRIYKRIIYPLYFVFPKWGELNYTVEYLITGSDTADTFATSVLKNSKFRSAFTVSLGNLQFATVAPSLECLGLYLFSDGNWMLDYRKNRLLNSIFQRLFSSIS